MSGTLSLEIVSPDRPVLKEDVDAVVLPAFEGELGVWPGHTPLLAQMLEGELRVKKGDEVRRLAISGGFAEIHPDRVEIFAETAELAEEIDAERARQALERARAQVFKVTDPKDLEAAEAALKRALIRIRVAEGLSRIKNQK